MEFIGFEKKIPTREEFINMVVNDLCNYGHDIPLLNEGQIRRHLLNEKFHYPEHLFVFLRNIANKVIDIFNKYLGDKDILEKILKEGLTIEDKTPYFDKVKFIVTLNDKLDINDPLSYTARYKTCGSLTDGKLTSVTIRLTIPYQNEKTITNNLMYPICHELTHVYDDWVSLVNSGKPAVLRDFEEGNMNLRKNGLSKGNPRFRQMVNIIYQMIYVTRQTESTAFISSAIQEFYDMGMDSRNFKDKIKETAYYKNLQAAKASCDTLINYANESDLISLNNEFKDGHYGKGLSAPKIMSKEIDTEKYREYIRDWADRLYHSALKRYYSAAWYYSEEYRYKIDDNDIIKDYSEDHLYF